MSRVTSGIAMASMVTLGSASSPCFGDDLLGIHFDTGAVYRISTTDASVTLLGSTGIEHFAGIDFGPDGLLYGFTAGEASVPVLYSINPANGFAATPIGPLGGQFIFEGSLVFAPDGRLLGVSHDGEKNPQLFTVNTSTGAATLIGTISAGFHDVNGLAWRSDGMLVGLDRVTNSLLAINPTTAASSIIAVLDPVVGAVGGMAVVEDTAYFSTSGPGLPSPGTNGLYHFDLFTGEIDPVGSLGPEIMGTGISGLAVPEPASLIILLCGATAGLMYHRSLRRR